MHIPKKYFHDRLVLFILSVNTFLALLASLLILLQLGGADKDYFVEFRNIGPRGQFTVGGVGTFISFIVFSLFVLVFHTLLSMRVYHMRRHFSVAVLGMGTLLILLTIIVANFLLNS